MGFGVDTISQWLAQKGPETAAEPAPQPQPQAPTLRMKRDTEPLLTFFDGLHAQKALQDQRRQAISDMIGGAFQPEGSNATGV